MGLPTQVLIDTIVESWSGPVDEEIHISGQKIEAFALQAKTAKAHRTKRGINRVLGQMTQIFKTVAGYNEGIGLYVSKGNEFQGDIGPYNDFLTFASTQIENAAEDPVALEKVVRELITDLRDPDNSLTMAARNVKYQHMQVPGQDGIMAQLMYGQLGESGDAPGQFTDQEMITLSLSPMAERAAAAGVRIDLETAQMLADKSGQPVDQVYWSTIRGVEQQRLKEKYGPNSTQYQFAWRRTLDQISYLQRLSKAEGGAFSGPATTIQP